MRFFLKVYLMLYVQSVMCSIPTPEQIHNYLVQQRLVSVYARILNVPEAMIVAANGMLSDRVFKNVSAGMQEDQKNPSNITSEYGKALKAEVDEIKKLAVIPKFDLSLNKEQKKECDALIVEMIRKRGVDSDYVKYMMRQMIYVVYQYYTQNFNRVCQLIQKEIPTIHQLPAPAKLLVIRKLTDQNVDIVIQALGDLEPDLDMEKTEYQVRFLTFIDAMHYTLEAQKLDYLLNANIAFRKRHAPEFINYLGSLYRQQVAKRLYESQQLGIKVLEKVERFCQSERDSRLAIAEKYQQAFDETIMCFERQPELRSMLDAAYQNQQQTAADQEQARARLLEMFGHGKAVIAEYDQAQQNKQQLYVQDVATVFQSSIEGVQQQEQGTREQLMLEQQVEGISLASKGLWLSCAGLARYLYQKHVQSLNFIEQKRAAWLSWYHNVEIQLQKSEVTKSRLFCRSCEQEEFVSIAEQQSQEHQNIVEQQRQRDRALLRTQGRRHDPYAPVISDPVQIRTHDPYAPVFDPHLSSSEDLTADNSTPDSELASSLMSPPAYVQLAPPSYEDAPPAYQMALAAQARQQLRR